jgi:hypothetical protein
MPPAPAQLTVAFDLPAGNLGELPSEPEAPQGAGAAADEVFEHGIGGSDRGLAPAGRFDDQASVSERRDGERACIATAGSAGRPGERQRLARLRAGQLDDGVGTAAVAARRGLI